jgi:hypothetical protein
MEILSAEDFPVFSELRKWRNAYAEGDTQGDPLTIQSL